MGFRLKVAVMETGRRPGWTRCNTKGRTIPDARTWRDGTVSSCPHFLGSQKTPAGLLHYLLTSVRWMVPPARFRYSTTTFQSESSIGRALAGLDIRIKWFILWVWMCSVHQNRRLTGIDSSRPRAPRS